VSDALLAHDGGEELVSRISHELRTPLAVIVGYGELLGIRNDDATRLAAADRILEAAGRLSKGIESTLTVLALDLIEVELIREPVELDRLVADAIALAGPGASGVDTQRVSVWPVVQADSERLTDTLAAALSSATAEAGRIEVDVEQRDANAALVICSGSEWTGTDGARLALYALGRVAARLGGSVTIRSSTDVSLELPLAHQKVMRCRRVLVVDDDPGVRNLLRVTLLTFEGLEIVEASSPAEALACLEKETPDLILLDWRMPEGSGAEVLEELVRRGHDVPVIVVTAEGESGRPRAESLGADMFLTKPFSPIQLLHTVEQLLPGLGTA
jgi:two-component system phosphate regulon response regulator PhoB